MKPDRASLVLVALPALLAMLAGCTQEAAMLNPDAPRSIAIETAFADGGAIPERFTCDGEDVALPITFRGLPDATAGLALLLDDPDAPAGTWTHWLWWNLPTEYRRLDEGADPAALGAVMGKNSWDRTDYGGPCPPSGTHRYELRAYALDGRLDLPPGADRRAFLAAVEAHVLAWGKITGTYGR